MSYMKVVVVAPNGSEYDAEVDADSDDQTLINELVRALGLPIYEDTGRITPINYGINVIGGTRIKDGVTLQIYVIPQPVVKDLRRRK